MKLIDNKLDLENEGEWGDKNYKRIIKINLEVNMNFIKEFDDIIIFLILFFRDFRIIIKLLMFIKIFWYYLKKSRNKNIYDVYLYILKWC